MSNINERLQVNNTKIDELKAMVQNLPDMPDIEPIYEASDYQLYNIDVVSSTNYLVHCDSLNNYFILYIYNPNNYNYYDLYIYHLEDGSLVDINGGKLGTVYNYYMSGRHAILYADDNFVDYVYGNDRYANPVYRYDVKNKTNTKIADFSNYEGYTTGNYFTVRRADSNSGGNMWFGSYNPETHAWNSGITKQYFYNAYRAHPDVLWCNDNSETKAFMTFDSNNNVSYSFIGMKYIVGMNYAKTKVFKSDGIYEYLGNGTVGNKIADLNIQYENYIRCLNNKYYWTTVNGGSSSNGRFRLYTFDDETNTFTQVLERNYYASSSSLTNIAGENDGIISFRDGTVIISEEGHTKEIGFTYEGKTYFYSDTLTPVNDANVLAGYYVYDKSMNRTVGTMPNNGALNITPSTSSQSIPEGYTSGGTVAAVTAAIDSNIVAENIREGVEILGVEGTVHEGAQGVVLYSTIAEMEEDTSQDEGTYGVVAGTNFEGVYKYVNSSWEQVGDPVEALVAFNGLAEVLGDSSEEYEGLGGTEEEITEILEDVIGEEGGAEQA